MSCRRRSYLGVADDTLRNQLIASSPLYSKYAEAVDRESAYEILRVKAQQDAEAAARAQGRSGAAERAAQPQRGF